MDTQPVWDSLSSFSIGQLVAWIIVISTIISILCAGTIKLYKIFTKYRNMKDKEQKQETIIENHDNTLKDIKNSLQEIKNSLNEQKEVNLKQLRYTLVQTCEDCLEKGEISTNRLRSIEEMYSEYVDVFHANGYVKVLVERVRDLKIVRQEEL